jgi:PAS domain S-box-containing protein
LANALGNVDESVLLAVAGRWLKALTECSKEVVALVDADGTIQFMTVSGAVQDLLGFDGMEIADKRAGELLHPDDEHRVLGAFRTLALEAGGKLAVEYRLRHKNGNWVRVQSTGMNRLDDPLIAAIIVHTREVAIPEVPVSTATPGVDPVTNLPDRAAFTEALTEAVERASSDSSFGFSLLIVEIDKLKMLVGNYGQELVDEMLAEAGAASAPCSSRRTPWRSSAVASSRCCSTGCAIAFTPRASPTRSRRRSVCVSACAISRSPFRRSSASRPASGVTIGPSTSFATPRWRPAAPGRQVGGGAPCSRRRCASRTPAT